MARKRSFFFDAQDHELLYMVNRFLERDQLAPQEGGNRFFHAGLHPHGIKQLAMSQEIRVAYAVINLLDTLEAGQVQDRINALRTLHNEVLFSAASSSFRYNTGRVLIQIMKSLIRAHGDPAAQLRLAHDFRRAATGRRRIIRNLLHRYYLLEMPEQWNQLAFDNHVHDANTKGRKSPTHLIMDAWIKGIRKLDVVYYNFVEPAAVSELLQAADIMGIKVRVGVEFQAMFRGRYVQFVWQPRGFADWREMLAFLEEKPTRHLMRMGREASLYHHEYVMSLLARYNDALRHEMASELGIDMTAISQNEVLSFVGVGQTSRTHLAELIYRRIRAGFAKRLESLREQMVNGDPAEKQAVESVLARFNSFSPEMIIDEWLCAARNPDVEVPYPPDGEGRKVPEIMRLLPETLIDWLTSIRTPCHITLNLCDLNVADVLELIYSCKGMISHLELYNLKNYESGRMAGIEAISELQTAINEGSAVALKRLIRSIIKEAGCAGGPESEDRCAIFMDILRNIPKLQGYYNIKPLGTRVGSDSTSRSSHVHGMGFAFVETLTARARKDLKDPTSQRKSIPLTQEVIAQKTYYLRRHLVFGRAATNFLRSLPGLAHFDTVVKETWQADEKTARFTKSGGNITTLGGFQRDPALDFKLEKGFRSRQEEPLGPAYLNTTVSNVLKVALGYLLTTLTFLYTQQWWFLAWFGPIIWFGITGFRNVLQATLGGGGLRRTPLLGWNAYLSWSRLCDSLMYTGFSVPLLELGVRLILLGRIFHIDAVSNPLVFYSVMGTINGIYIAAHNTYRGLPREAVIGNIFRSVLAIPVSIFYSFIAYEICDLGGFSTFYLVQGAAVISKLASDSVAAVIEGFADKAEYFRMRHWDYTDKLSQLFTCYSRLEILLPEEDVMELLRRPKDFMRTVGRETKDLEKVIIVNALDLMYFWMYQPRARSTLARHLLGMTPEERGILAHSQLVLTRVHEISQMLVDGLVGHNFARPLAFYLARHEDYLRDMARLTGIKTLAPERPEPDYSE